MRLRFRLRTALIAIALLSPPLAGISVVARHGGLSGYRNYHARMAYRYWLTADDLGLRVKLYRENREPAERIEELRRHESEYLRKARWHEFLSGRPIAMTRL